MTPSTPMIGADRSRVLLATGLGLVAMASFWFAFTGPLPLADYCGRPARKWVLAFWDQPRAVGITAVTFMAALAVATLAYLVAVRLAVGLTGRLAYTLLLGLVPLGLIAALAPGYPVLSGDVFKYVFDGRILALYGLNPFLHVPAEFPNDPFLPTIFWKDHVNGHGPIWRLAEAVSAGLAAEDCALAVQAMRAWTTAGYVVTIGVVFALLRSWRPEQAVWGTMLYAWNPLVLLEAVQSGHNDVVAALPTVLAIWAAHKQRFRLAFPLLAVGALVKPLAVLVGPVLLVAALRAQGRPRRDALVGIGIAAGLVIAAYAPFWESPSTLQGLARAHLFAASPARFLQSSLREAGVAPGQAEIIATVAAHAVFLLLFGLILRVTWLGRGSVVAAALGTLFSYLLVGAQWFNPWYLLWLAPLAALVPDWRARILAVAFTLLAPLVYPLDNRAAPVLLAVFLPLVGLLAAWFRQVEWLGGPRQTATVDAAPSPMPNLP